MFFEFSWIIIFTALILFTYYLTGKSSFYSNILQSGACRNRYTYLDGLRGVLALGVFFCHSVISYYFYISGKWEIPPMKFVTIMGELAVVLFFMITGAVFWSKILSERPFDVTTFYISRFKRILPMYLVSLMFSLMVIIISSKFNFKGDIYYVLNQLRLLLIFDFKEYTGIGFLNEDIRIQSVYWSLRYECIFYIFFPLLTVFKKNLKFFFIAIFFLFLIFFSAHILNIILGMIAAIIQKEFFPKLPKQASYLINALSLISLIALFVFFSTAYSYPQSLLAFLFFIPILSIDCKYTILLFKPLRALGVISYSFYVLHQVFIFITFKFCNIFVAKIATLNKLELLICIFIAGAISTVFSLFTYKNIEYKFYARNNH